MTVPAVILAGGLSRRMGGGDKCLRLLAGRPLLAHVIARLSPQCAPLALNANGDPARFAAFGLRVMADSVAGHPGPLAGILAAMDWAAGLGAAAVLTSPADTPFLPQDLAERLAAGGNRPVIAASPDATGVLRGHPATGLWPVHRRDALRRALAGGMRRMTDWTVQEQAVTVVFTGPPPDPFLNINTPAELAAAEAFLR